MRPKPGPAARRVTSAMFEGRPLANPSEEIFDQGLAFDLGTLLDRRRMLRLIGFFRPECGALPRGVRIVPQRVRGSRVGHRFRLERGRHVGGL